jgi:quercetin dioxygenase-like cupin family protein
MQLCYEDEVINVGAGDMAVFSAQAPHGLRNASQAEPALALVAASPPW